jgi:hypothetical protein
VDNAYTAKQRWAARHTQIKITVRPEIAEKFKARCLAEGITITDKLKGYMVNAPNAELPVDPYGTRQKRRKAVAGLIRECEAIIDAEQQYIDRMPENLESSPMHEAAEQTVDILSEAVELLSNAF